MINPTLITFAFLFTLFWLVALAAHLVLLKFLLTPYERVKLRLPTGSWPLLLTMTIADLVALLTAFPFTSISAIFNHWFFGEVICDMSSYVKVASLTVSSYIILGLLMQSYEMVVKTTRPPMSTVNLGLLIGSICLLAVVTALPMLWSHSVVIVKTNEQVDQNLEAFEYENRSLTTLEPLMRSVSIQAVRKYCGPTHKWKFRFYWAKYIYLPVFAVPLAIVVYLFIKITDAMSKQAGQGKSLKNNTGRVNSCDQNQTTFI